MMDYGDNTAEALDSEKEHIGPSTHLINQFNKYVPGMGDYGHVVFPEYRASYRDPVSDLDILLKVLRGAFVVFVGIERKEEEEKREREERKRREEEEKRVRRE